MSGHLSGLLSHFEDHEKEHCDLPVNNPSSAMAPCEYQLINVYHAPRRGRNSILHMEKGSHSPKTAQGNDVKAWDSTSRFLVT